MHNPLDKPNEFKSRIEQAGQQFIAAITGALEEIVGNLTQAHGFNRDDLVKHLGITQGKIHWMIYNSAQKEILGKFSTYRKNENGKTERIYLPEAVTVMRKMLETEQKPKLSRVAIREKGMRMFFGKNMGIGQIAQSLGVPEDSVQKALLEFGIMTSRYISNHYPTLNDLMATQVGKIPLYTKEKQREEMIAEGSKHIKGPVSYLGLEGPNFTSYILTAQAAGVKPKESLVPERNQHTYNLMRSIVKAHNSIDGGKIFRGLNLYRGAIEHALRQPEYKKQKYDWVNLDFEGGWAPEKGRTIASLFEEGKINSPAVLFVTLNNEERMRHNCEVNTGNADQGVAVTNFVTERAGENSCTAELMHETAYKSKLEHTKPMLLLGYKIMRHKNG
jgi:hypothetical protein